jgi:single-stranded-DNA-specific exonuclease
MKWELKEKIEKQEVSYADLHPKILQILIQRGIDDEKKIQEYIFPNYEKGLFDPFLFLDMKKVVERIRVARDKKEKIAIFGDYDADGVTSSVILKETLEQIGLETVVYIPDKKLEGYGMNMKAIEELGGKKISLILTVDCGITNIQEVEKAKKMGMDVIIIDHHYVPEKIPNAFAIINPHQKGSGYPFSELAGVGVTFKVVQALFFEFLKEKIDHLKWVLDLVAIGTIADCVPLIEENRVIASFGLIVLSKTRRVGLLELFRVGKFLVDENNPPKSRTVAFQIAPRINAAGRMDHANNAFNLIQEKKQVSASTLALDLESNNLARQKATLQVVDEVRILGKNMFKNKKFVFAVGEHFPVGIVGLAAGRIADEFNKPTGILCKGENFSQGSFRSIPEINIIETIEKCSHLLMKYGGHSQAAGVSVENDKLDEFFKTLGEIIEIELEGKEIFPTIQIDAELNPSDIDFDLTCGIRKMEPFGEGNEEPVFLMKNLEIEEIRKVGKTEKHLKLLLKATDGTPKIFEAIGFNLSNGFQDLKKGDRIDIVFNICEDNWNGNKKIQLKLIDLKII